MTKSQALIPPTVSEIGKYKLVAELARGGMGNVYLASTHGPGGFSKLVALKELKPELCDDEIFVTMFLEEARLAARLTHPNIVQTNEVGSDGRRHFMVMEYLDGRSLYRIGKRMRASLSVGAHLRVIADALLGLQYVHDLCGFDGKALGIVHRDVSPLNIFVTFEGQTKVIDFGIAKSADSSLDTKSGILKGRVTYMAPEQARGARVDCRADVYSAGVMIWEAASGLRRWPHIGEAEVLARLSREPAPSLRSVQPDAPEELDWICARAMAHRPQDRYATAAELLRDLESHLARRDDTMTPRALGALVDRAFGEERQSMNSLIQETLRGVRRGLVSGVRRAIKAPVSATAGAPASGVPRVSGGQMPLNTPGNSFGPLANSYSRSVAATAATLAPSPEGAPPARPRTSRAAKLSACVALLAVFVLPLVAVWHRGRGPTLEPQSAAIAAVQAPAIAASARAIAAMSHVVVSASPKSARITIDDEPVSNPYVADVRRESSAHRVFVQAAGYQSRPSTVTYDDDVDLQIALDPVRVFPPTPRRASSPAGSAMPNCQPPYTIDQATGKKRWRMECL